MPLDDISVNTIFSNMLDTVVKSLTAAWQRQILLNASLPESEFADVKTDPPSCFARLRCAFAAANG
jgi:hypothetical protein